MPFENKAIPKISFFYRNPKNFFSIENLFDDLLCSFKNDFECKKITCPHSRATLRKIISNTLFSIKKQSDINHITGHINYLAIFLSSKKTILTIHDVGFIEGNNFIKNFILKYFWLQLPIHRAKFVTVISEETKKQLKKLIHIDEKKLKVIHNCVSNRFKFSPYKFKIDKPVILHIGTKKNKNLSRLIMALKGVNCTLMIIGPLSNQHLTELKNYNIDFINKINISDKMMVDAYRESDLVSFISTYEGFGLPIIEANAVGRPVITSNISSMPEVANDAAILVDPYSIDSIRKGVLEIFQNQQLRDTLIEKGLINVRRFSVKKIANDYKKLYEEILN